MREIKQFEFIAQGKPAEAAKEQVRQAMTEAVTTGWKLGDGVIVDTDLLPRAIIKFSPNGKAVQLRPRYNNEDWINTGRLIREQEECTQSPQNNSTSELGQSLIGMQVETPAPASLQASSPESAIVSPAVSQDNSAITRPSQTQAPSVTEKPASEGKKSSDPQSGTGAISAVSTTPTAPVKIEHGSREGAPQSALSLQQRAKLDSARNSSGLAAKLATRPVYDQGNAPHLIIRALAGTGKTTTLIEGLKHIFGMGEKRFVPSPQQSDVWDAMLIGPRPRSSLFAAFNATIADELRDRVPRGVGCQARTLHGFGYTAVLKAFKIIRDPEDGARAAEIISEVSGVDLRVLRKTQPVLLKATKELVSLCKANLVGLEPGTDWDAELQTLIKRYTIEVEDQKERVFDLVPRVLERSKDVAADGYVDFDDMPWLPIVLKLPIFKNALMLVDEAQDLNRCQQALAMMGAHRLILCGDVHQAIYGFAGADSESMGRMGTLLKNAERGCLELPLTVTRRCGKKIVEEAKDFVPEFEAHPSNPPGKVDRARYPIQERLEGRQRIRYELPYEQTYLPKVQDGDMILCRANAPLVNQCFRFLKRGRKAFIQGRNVADALITLLERIETPIMTDMLANLSDWHRDEVAKEMAQRNPSETKIEGIGDRFSCMRCFIDEAKPDIGQAWTPAVVRKKIDSVFTDNREAVGIKLSSIHRAKGLESKRVWYIQGFGRPDDKIASDWEREQEDNLKYVAITRAIEELWYVS